MSCDRLTPEWLEGYIGDRLYNCPRCGKTDMRHDETYRHELFECPDRPGGSASSQNVRVRLL